MENRWQAMIVASRQDED
uniref:Virus infectivity factor n=1 Tax=Human immunodeficiency virus type 1 TaxID=11676 RepID=Q73442_HV1|nr:virus infectivity factor [Human immunodeficiency virus 1]